MFKDKTMIVTGGARGIGEAIAVKLARGGANIVIWDVMEDIAQETAARLGDEYSIKAVGAGVDVTSAEAVEGAAKAALDEFGAIDGLVNNAGITRDNIILRMKEEDWDMVLNINLKGAFLCTKTIARYMLKARQGRIVNIASVIGLMGNAGQANYGASKAGLIGLTKTSAKEFASRGVTVNAVAPGYIRTAMTDKLKDDVKEAMLKLVPLGSLGEPEDVAACVEFLLSDSSRYVTGQVLTVDGGMVM